MNTYLTKEDKSKIATLKRLLEKKNPHQNLSISAVIRHCIGYTYANTLRRK